MEGVAEASQGAARRDIWSMEEVKACVATSQVGACVAHLVLGWSVCRPTEENEACVAHEVCVAHGACTVRDKISRSRSMI